LSTDPPEADLRRLDLLVSEPGLRPPEPGLVAGLYFDVTHGTRTLRSARSIVEAEADTASLPDPCCQKLIELVFALKDCGRSVDALRLSELLLAGIESSRGRECPLWLKAARGRIQAATGARKMFELGPTDIADAREQVIEATPAIAEAALEVARRIAPPAERARLLSAIGQHWLRLASEKDGEEADRLFERARESLAEAAALRSGPERGRTLSTLAQLLSGMCGRGLVGDPEVSAIASEAISLTDREQKPVQWLAARQLLKASERERLGLEGFGLRELIAVRNRHGAETAARCLLLEARSLLAGHEGVDAQIVRDGWEALPVSALESQELRRDLLEVAVHALDQSGLSCAELSDQPSGLLERTDNLSPGPRVLGRLHAAFHTRTAELTEWALREAPAQLDAVGGSPDREAAEYAVARMHADVAGMHADQAVLGAEDQPALAFRCAVLAARGFAVNGLGELGGQILGNALQVARAWGAGAASTAPGDLAAARRELEEMLDACLREAASIDAVFADRGRGWLLDVGRALSSPARSGPTARPLYAAAHSLAFKGAVSTRLLLAPGLWQEEDDSRKTREQIASAEAEEPREALAGAAADYGEELRLCAWLHGTEMRSGAQSSQRRRNLQAIYDETLIRRMVSARPPAGLGFGDLEPARLLARSGGRTALLDLYLGHHGAGTYACFATVYSPADSRQFVVRGTCRTLTAVPDPDDPDARLALDGLAPLVATIRHRVQEPSGARPVSRGGAEALQAGAVNLLGFDAGVLAELREEGCDHLAICPHGPLAFLPWHLLPVGSRLLADDWTVTVVPTLGSVLAPSRSAEAGARGIIVSPEGGAGYGLAAEPALEEQARELAGVGPGGVVLAGGRATPAAALKLLARSRHAHLAAHGSALGHAPSFHCLYLDEPPTGATGVDEPAAGDGRLFAHHLMHADLRGLDLVTLCACETALGRADFAGNVRGLPLGFLSAGARAVVATLWPVAAEPALGFFAELHAELAAGADKLSAFRRAQISCRARHPRFADWGAFTFLGSWT
jgi:hypothetical protein